MRTVSDTEDGRRYVLLKQSGDASLVRDPETGERRHLPRERLEPVDEPPLSTAAAAVPEPVRRLVTAVPDERALGLVVELDARGPLSVHALLEDTTLCESDLHGLLGELRAAGLVEGATVAGRRGYAATEDAAAALDRLR